MKQKWSSRHRATYDVHRPGMILRYTDGSLHGFGRLRRGKAYETRHATAMLLTHFKLSTCSYFNLHEIQSLCCKRILDRIFLVRPDIPSFAETGKIYICEQLEKQIYSKLGKFGSSFLFLFGMIHGSSYITMLVYVS